jgi:hypothetical protein
LNKLFKEYETTQRSHIHVKYQDDEAVISIPEGEILEGELRKASSSSSKPGSNSESDVDFLVEMEANRNLFDLGGLLMELQDLLGCKVDVVTEKGLRQRIRERVLNEAVPL